MKIATDADMPLNTARNMGQLILSYTVHYNSCSLLLCITEKKKLTGWDKMLQFLIPEL